MTLVNCTNHHISLEVNNLMITLPPSGYVARVSMERELLTIIDDIPVFRNIDSYEIKGLPAPKEQTIYITSNLVARMAKRPDVMCPNHAPDQCTRDPSGRIISTRSLLTFYE